MKFRQFIHILAIIALIACFVPPVFAADEAPKDEATTYYNYAEMAISTNDFEGAVAFFDKALASNTTIIRQSDALQYTYKDKCGALTDLGRYDEAIKTAELGLTEFPKSSGLWNNKGYAYYKMGKYNEAVDAYNNALRIDPSYLKGWNNKGDAYFKMGKYNEAVDAYNKALALDQGNRDAKTGLTTAQQAAASATQTSMIAIAIVIIIVAVGAVWYFKFRKPEVKPEEKKSKEKKE
ncbi:MAG: tetratricopeptide repeat protein [Methanoregula sp.]|nr:tetratricopeptide repeat protein [Methanoregula sp.]